MIALAVRLGLDQYASLLMDHDITLNAFLTLEDVDLREMGDLLCLRRHTGGSAKALT